MLFKHIISYVLFNWTVSVCGLMGRKHLTPAKGQELLESVVKLTDSLIEITPYLNSTLAEIPANCVQMMCKFVCFNGIATDIEMEISMVAKKHNYSCSSIEELRLYNYVFPGEKLSRGFLGNYSDKVKILYLASANITDVEAGAFARGIFSEIYFENLQLKELRRDFFSGVSRGFTTISIVQKQMPIETVHRDFLANVKYLIKSLTLQAGLKSISNLTGGDFLLNNLARSDFSHNDFGSRTAITAFSMVSRLQWLDLSNSKLEYIPTYLFADIITTLEYLDLSHNKLKTISRYMFGWKEIPRDLKIFGEENEWLCSCELQHEIRFINLHYRLRLVCSEPDIYQGFSLFDDRICDTDVEPLEPKMQTTTTSSQAESYSISTIVEEENGSSHTYDQTTELQLNETSNTFSPPGYHLPTNFMKLDCSNKLFSHMETTVQLLCRPLITFSLFPRESWNVDVIVGSSEQTHHDFGLVWFSRHSSKYHIMEGHHNAYGLGCYQNISAVTSVRHLKPNTAYTFCMVFKQKFNVSPFNCKSIHVGNNLDTKTSAWITRDMKITSFILFIFGVAMFVFAGILMIYLLLKHKPTLVKRNQHVTTLNRSQDKTIVLPCQKSLQPVRVQHERLTSCGLFCSRRRKSTDSDTSYESYINANIYEVIPAFDKLNTNTDNEATPTSVDPSPLYQNNNQDTDSYYLTPLESIPSAAVVLQYADIPGLSKPNSTNALPQLPAEVPYARIGNIYFLDSHV